MCERLKAVRDVRRAAQGLTAACAGSCLADVYASVVAEPVPAPILALLDALTDDSPVPRRRRWFRRSG